MPKPFLLLQLRPEQIAADDEYEAFLRASGLPTEQLQRIQIDKDFPAIDLDEYSGIIVGGGPSNVSSPDEQKYDYQKIFEPKLIELINEIVDRDFPYLGECYGLGILAHVIGGIVDATYHEDVGAVTIKLTSKGKNDPLLTGLPYEFRAFVGHKEACRDVPPGAVLLAKSDTCPVHMIRFGRNVYATQFHPELDSHGLEVRINVYMDAGYFPPADAQELIELGHKEIVTAPAEILRRFVGRYSTN